jgi:hypothetical protein
MFLIAAALFGAELVSAQPARTGDRAARQPEVEYKALSLKYAAAEVPLVETPPVEAVRTAYPSEARATTSSVALNCAVLKGGVLTDCKINRADPDNERLKAVALKLSHEFKVSPTYPSSEIMLFMQFSGRVARCLMPFCMPELIQPPPTPPAGVCVPPVARDVGPPCPDAKPNAH